MLVEFRVKNFRSLRDEQVLSLVASKDKTLQDIDVDHACFDVDAHGAKRVRSVQSELCSASTRQLTAFVDVGPMKRTHRISQAHSHPQTRCSHVGRDRREGAQCWRCCC